jgi:hypothetical protein
MRILFRLLPCVVAALLVCSLVQRAAGRMLDGQNKKNQSLSWNPPDTDSNPANLSTSQPCSLPEVMQKAADRASDLVDNLQKFDAVESSEYLEKDSTLTPTGSDKAEFDYMADFERNGSQLMLKESREEINKRTGDVALLEDVGLPALALIFHPIYSIDFAFACEGASDWDGRPAWLVRFRQFKGRPSRLMAFRTQEGTYAAKLKGRAWVSQKTGDIIHLETNLVEAIAPIGLLSSAVSIDYAPVQFRTADVELWLPQTAVAYSQYDKYQIVKRHSYSNFKLFSVGIQQVIEKPKVPATQPPGSEAPATTPPK